MYDTFENSVDKGRPYWLYFFDDGVVTPVRFTSDEEDIETTDDEDNILTWVASPIDASDIEINGNVERQDTSFVFPITDTFAQKYLESNYAITTCTVYRGHHGDPDQQLSVHWKGRIIGGEATDDGIKLTAESIFTSTKRIGNRAKCQRQCRWALYRPGCNLNRADFEEVATVTAVNGLVLTVPEAETTEPDEYKAGIINFNGVFGMVEIHDGDQLTLLTKIYGLEDYVTANGSASILIAPGCNRTTRRCVDRFDNGLNNGGFEKLPEINPFDTSIV